jgi:hypothetical protein
MDDEQPYVIKSPTRIRLGPEAQFWAKEHGMTLEELARYLLNKENLEGESYAVGLFD